MESKYYPYFSEVSIPDRMIYYDRLTLSLMDDIELPWDHWGAETVSFRVSLFLDIIVLNISLI